MQYIASDGNDFILKDHTIYPALLIISVIGQGVMELEMVSEIQKIQDLFTELCKQSEFPFPQHGKTLNAPSQPGVYIIRKGKTVLHVGRTLRGRRGLHQRLKNHLHGSSSFTNKHLNGKGDILRKNGYTYQYLMVKSPRLRALLEAYTVGNLCPKHIGLGT